MFQRAEVCLPRKKKVLHSFHSNTYRIFDERLPDRLNPDEFYKNHKYPTRDLGESELLKTHNIPQPRNAKFIRTNVKFLDEPIAHMETEQTKNEQFKWWLNTDEQSVASKGRYSKETTQRSDYQAISRIPFSRRDRQNRTLATGIVPTLSPTEKPKEFLEQMSFTSQCNSRRLHDQPYRGRTHGASVCRERGREGPSAFQSTEGPCSPLDPLSSSQRASPQSSPQSVLSEALSTVADCPKDGMEV